MPQVRAFIQSEVRSVVKRLRINAGFTPDIRLWGYTFLDLEERAEQVPASDLFLILNQIDDGTLHAWWLEFNLELYELNKKEKSK